MTEWCGTKHFLRHEFECDCGCGFDTVDVELFWVLLDLRVYFGRPVVINSGCRCPYWNQHEGGEDDSQHLEGKAADVWIPGTPADLVADYLETKYPNQYGIGRYRGRTHIDTRSYKARWDNR